ncbi:6714_t:CDS:1, partial [Racocetra persica]
MDNSTCSSCGKTKSLADFVVIGAKRSQKQCDTCLSCRDKAKHHKKAKRKQQETKE